MADLKLKPHPSISKPSGPVLVVIMDGLGENVEDEFNAVSVAKSPTLDELKAKRPQHWRTVRAHGTAVGLPSDEDMGNSEVGHNALGSGQVISQGAKLVDNALEDKSILQGEGWKFISPAFEQGTLHLIGLLSDGGVHSRTDQLFQLMRFAAESGAKCIRLHVLTDGRDVPDGSSIDFVNQTEEETQKLLKEFNCDARIASGGGRMFVTMDRYEADWEIVERGWKAHVLGQAENKFKSAAEAVKTLRGSEDKPVSDQWLPPFVIVDEGGAPVGPVQDGDAVVLFNFRADRMIEISKAFEYEDFHRFERQRYPKVRFAGMMQYDGDLQLPKHFLVPPPAIKKVSGAALAATGLSTFACAETQKFGHVTFFWNGNNSGYINQELETFVEIPSDKLPFNEKPEMKAREVAEAVKAALEAKKYNQVRVNFANPDMVGHTGDLKAAITAVEVVDSCLKELVKTVEEVGGRYLITADHGNCDCMVQRHKKTLEPLRDENGKPLPLTSHTLALVPVAIGGEGTEDIVFRDDLPSAGLANVTATYVNLMGYLGLECWEPSLITSTKAA